MSKKFTEWLSWMESLNAAEIDLGLGRCRTVFNRLILKPFSCPIITIAGTNGKGSTVAVLESLALEAKLKPLAYTSPHFIDYKERVRFSGDLLTEQQHIDAFQAVEDVRMNEPLTYFEFATLASFKLAEMLQPDLLLLETGLGGRLDAVNIVDADIAIITTVDFDHQQWLGDDLESIAREKAGIVAADKIALIGDPLFPKVIIDEIASKTPHVYLAGRDFKHEQSGQSYLWQNEQYGEWSFKSLNFPFSNVSVALQAWSLMDGFQTLTESFVFQALDNIQLTGRFDTIAVSPELIIDVAHNPQAFRIQSQLLKQKKKSGQTHLIIGMLDDKNIEACLEILKQNIDHWYFCDLPSSRNMSATQLHQVLKDSDIDGNRLKCYSSPIEAYQAANKRSSEEDIILVTGSFYTVAPILVLVREASSNV